MTIAEWFQFIKEAGAYISPLLFGALLWMNAERNRFIKIVSEKDVKIESLSERVITLATKLEQFLFSGERRQ